MSTIFLLLLTVAHAAIFGSDDRREPYEVPGLEKISSSTAMMQSEAFVLPDDQTKTYTLDFLLSTDQYGTNIMCADQKFSDQHAGYVNCTGFLVSEDTIVTAGHCMIYSHNPLPKTIYENERPPFCENFKWVFGYEKTATASERINGISPDNIYSCEKVIYAELFGYPLDDKGEILLPVNPNVGLDFAIIKLDRKVVGRTPVQLATEAPSVSDPVFTLGYPMALPLKYSGNAKVLANNYANYFVTDLDIIGGNSGSPVFNSKNEVIGIAVRSFPSEDFVYDEVQKCMRVSTCEKLGEGACTITDGHPLGTHVNRITPVINKLKELGIL
ncbi:MAG: trypsin-like peptidase domain-containing protein [Bdellovibrionaceae bacterium]|nr:trypsin-like peptidase domain-containing protein [Pseudobdellovibrionaceae bacterium]